MDRLHFDCGPITFLRSVNLGAHGKALFSLLLEMPLAESQKCGGIIKAAGIEPE